MFLMKVYLLLNSCVALIQSGTGGQQQQQQKNICEEISFLQEPLKSPILAALFVKSVRLKLSHKTSAFLLQIHHLQKVLAKKRDPVTHVCFMEELVKVPFLVLPKARRALRACNFHFQYPCHPSPLRDTCLQAISPSYVVRIQSRPVFYPQDGNNSIASFWESVTSILTQEFAQAAQGLCFVRLMGDLDDSIFAYDVCMQLAVRRDFHPFYKSTDLRRLHLHRSLEVGYPPREETAGRVSDRLCL